MLAALIVLMDWTIPPGLTSTYRGLKTCPSGREDLRTVQLIRGLLAKTTSFSCLLYTQWQKTVFHTSSTMCFSEEENDTYASLKKISHKHLSSSPVEVQCRCNYSSHSNVNWLWDKTQNTHLWTHCMSWFILVSLLAINNNTLVFHTKKLMKCEMLVSCGEVMLLNKLRAIFNNSPSRNQQAEKKASLRHFLSLEQAAAIYSISHFSFTFMVGFFENV